MDKASIQQDRIEDSLALLPIFLAGCRTFVLLLGPTYTRRLWCVIELFTWLRMGGRLDRIVVLPFGAGQEQTEAEALRAFADFDARRASCYVDNERQHLLGVIEGGFGTLEAFNALINRTFQESNLREGGDHFRLHTRKPGMASTAGAPGTVQV